MGQGHKISRYFFMESDTPPVKGSHSAPQFWGFLSIYGYTL